jgi:hypothetical protein
MAVSATSGSLRLRQQEPCTLSISPRLGVMSGSGGGELSVRNLELASAGRLTVDLLGAILNYNTETTVISGILVVPKKGHRSPIEFSKERQSFYTQERGEMKAVGVDREVKAKAVLKISTDLTYKLTPDDIKNIKNQLEKMDFYTSKPSIVLPDQQYEVCEFKQVVSGGISSLSLQFLTDGQVNQFKLDGQNFLDQLRCTSAIPPHLDENLVRFQYQSGATTEAGIYPVRLVFKQRGESYRKECDLPPLETTTPSGTTSLSLERDSEPGVVVPTEVLIAAGAAVVLLGLFCGRKKIMGLVNRVLGVQQGGAVQPRIAAQSGGGYPGMDQGGARVVGQGAVVVGQPVEPENEKG